MSGGLAGRRAIVTGAASGIGRATALRLSQEGARVLATDRDEAGLSGLGDVETMRHDVASETDWTAVAEAARARLGGVDILVNNAGTVSGRSIEMLDIATWNALLAINLTGTMLGCRTAIALMRDAGRPGAIVNIGSTSAHAALPGDAAYTASKGAVIALTRSVAVHCARAGLPIRCNALTPGATDTAILRALPDAARAAIAATSPLDRLADPDEMAAAVLFLVGDECPYMTGAELVVDGAALAVHPGF